MKKKLKGLISLLILLAVSFSACSKKGSMSDGLGGGGGDNGEGKASIQYLSFMYDPSKGSGLNETAINIPEYSLLKDDIQTALDVMMKFPYQTNINKAEVTPRWYNSVPSDIKNTYPNSLAVAMEKYFQTTEGKNYVNVYLQDLNTKLTNLQTNLPDGSSTDYVKYAKLGFEIAAMLAAQDYASMANLAFSAIGSVFGFSGGDSQMAAINQKLDQIVSQLKDIQIKLNQIEFKIDVAITKIDSIGLNNAKAHLSSVAGYLNNPDTNTVKTNLISNEIEYGTNFNVALSSAQEVFDDIATKLGSSNTYNLSISNIPNYRITLDRESDFIGDKYGLSNGEKLKYCYHETAQNNILNQTISIKRPEYYISGKKDNASSSQRGVSLEDAALLKRFSLLRLAYLEKIYTGNDLLKQRSYFAKQDWSKLKILKNRIINIINLIQSDIIINNYPFKNFYVSDPFHTLSNDTEANWSNYWANASSSYSETSWTSELIPGLIFSRKQNSKYEIQFYNSSLTWENKYSFIYNQYADILNQGFSCGESSCYTAQITTSNIFPATGTENDFQNTRKQIIKNWIVKDWKTTDSNGNIKSEIKDYIVAYAALLADWEIQLRAHAKVNGEDLQ